MDLKNIKIIANSGSLVNGKEIDVKCDCDPTTVLVTNVATDVTFRHIFCETVKFIKHNNTRKPYLSYPQMYLNSNKPKCKEMNNCKQCSNASNKNNNYILSICARKRREIGNELFDAGQIRNCMSDSNSLSRTARQLMVSDKMLIKDSTEYKLSENWFAKVYSLLKWQQEVISVLLHNLVGLDKHETRKQQLSQDESKDIDDCLIQRASNTIFLHKFDLLVLLHSYLDELVDYLVLYFCCFNSQRWISVFYPFIEAAIGTLQCNLLFAEPRENSKQLTSLCNQVLEFNKENGYDLEELMIKEMKGVSIFQQLLCNVYNYNTYNYDATDTRNNIIFDPFDLAMNIGIKLNESVLNIKTQMMINEMTGVKIYRSRASTAASRNSSHNHKEKKDDWEIKDTDKRKFNLKVPSFIRLFVIRRIIDNYCKDKCNILVTSEQRILFNCKLIGDLAKVFDNNIKTQETVKDILYRLVNFGIKIYMQNDYNESKQAHVVEEIFKKIIFTKFEKEYTELTTLNSINNNDNANTTNEIYYYQNLVFNSNDMMSTIFEYLDYGDQFDGDLFCCSLVNSYWLYHSWNVNSVYHVNLDRLIEETLKYNDIENEDNCVLRLWQRLIYVKSIAVRVSYETAGHNVILNKLLMLKHIEKINGYFAIVSHTMNLAILKTIISRSKARIKCCDIHVDTSRSKLKKTNLPRLSPLTLRKATSIVVRDLYFYRIWSNQCTKITFHGTEMYNLLLTKDRCQFWIDHCDCSNISILELVKIKFDDESILILKQLASKFSNLQQLKIDFYRDFDQNVILFWKLLKPTILKNNVKVELKIWFNEKEKSSSLNQMMVHHNLTIESLVAVTSNYHIINFINIRDNYGLENLSAYKIKMLANLLSFKSITSFRAIAPFRDIVDFLGFNVIVNKQLFVIVDKEEQYSSKTKKVEFLSLFKQLCQNVCKLIFQQIAVDIKISFKEADQTIWESCAEIYSSHFQSKDISKNYNEPRCKSKLCSPRMKPYVYLIPYGVKSFAFRATNVKYDGE